jgi:hypothetical protein
MVSIKPLDCLHLVTPIAAQHKVMQIFGRTRRPDEGKLVPLVRYYVDEGGQLSGAYNKVLAVVVKEGWDVEKINITSGSVAPTSWRVQSKARQVRSKQTSLFWGGQ